MGFELWIVNNGTIFDNILVTDSIDYAKEQAEKLWRPTSKDEKEKKEAWDKEVRLPAIFRSAHAPASCLALATLHSSAYDPHGRISPPMRPRRKMTRLQRRRRRRKTSCRLAQHEVKCALRVDSGPSGAGMRTCVHALDFDMCCVRSQEGRGERQCENE